MNFRIEKKDNQLFIFHKGVLIYKKWFDDKGNKKSSSLFCPVFGRIEICQEQNET